MKPAETYSVKEFANLAGVTVRTLQYYDREELLKPSMYTEAKHRLYRREDLLRLQQILTLKYIGFSLDDIRQLLNSPVYDVTSSLRIQKEAIDQRIEQLQKVSQALELSLNTLASLKPAELDWGVVSELIHGLLAAEKWRWVNRYYTPEQEEILRARQAQFTPQEMLQSQRDWAELIALFQSQQAQGAMVSDPDVQKLAAKMEKLLHSFTQGDAGITQSLRRMYQDLEQMPEDQRPYDAKTQRFMCDALDLYLLQKA